MNSVIEQLLAHKSIRKFTDGKLTTDQIETLVRAAQSASTSSYVQAYSIIGVTDEAIKKELREISTQSYVEHNGHLFVFVADYHRHALMSEQHGVDIHNYLGSTESFLVGTIDAALAAQNMAVAAESMDLGICYIGSLRNDMQRVIELLELPQWTYPLFGMVVGHSADTAATSKIRLPLHNVYHENHYNNDDISFMEQIDAYDKDVSAYYMERTNGERSDAWSDQIVAFLNKKTRQHVDGVVKGQGFLKQ